MAIAEIEFKLLRSCAFNEIGERATRKCVGGGADAALGSQSQDSNWVLKCKWGLLAFQSKLEMIMRERNRERNIERHCGRSVDGCGSVFPAVTR